MHSDSKRAIIDPMLI